MSGMRPGLTPIKFRLPGLAHVLQHELPVYDFFLLFHRDSQVLFHYDEDHPTAFLPRYMYIEYNLGPTMTMPLNRWRGGRLPPLFYTKFDEDKVFEREEEIPLEMLYDMNKFNSAQEGHFPKVARTYHHTRDAGQASNDGDDCLQPQASPGDAPVDMDSSVHEHAQTESIAVETCIEPAAPTHDDYVYDAEFEPWRGQSIDWSEYQPSCDYAVESSHTLWNLSSDFQQQPAQAWAGTEIVLEPMSSFCADDTQLQGWGCDIPWSAGDGFLDCDC